MVDLQVPATTTKHRPKTNSSANSKAAKRAKSRAKKLPVHSTSHATQVDITATDRLHMISEAAYYRAEQSGFVPDKQWQDWFEAEKAVDAMLHKQK